MAMNECKLGDRVWPVYDNNGWTVGTQFKVAMVGFVDDNPCVSPDETMIFYYPVTDVFSTLDEAESECERRND